MKKIWRSIMALFIVFFYSLAVAQDDKNEQKLSISEVNEPLTVQLLANFEILKELNTRSSPYFARVVKVKDPGECDGALETCPKETLYVVVSTYDEFPEQKVYLLTKAHRWRFLKWISIPKEESTQSFITIRLGRQEISIGSHRKKTWVETEVDVKVNPWEGFVTNLSGKASNKK